MKMKMKPKALTPASCYIGSSRSTIPQQEVVGGWVAERKKGRVLIAKAVLITNIWCGCGWVLYLMGDPCMHTGTDPAR